MDRLRFERLVARAIEELPEEFLDRLENIDVVVQDIPTRAQLAKAGVKKGWTLLGLYEGVPITERDTHYGLVAPDKITIFQKPVEEKCQTDDCIAGEVRRVVQHEIAHHFGIDDERLEELGRDSD